MRMPVGVNQPGSPRPESKINVMLMTDVIGRGGAEKSLVDLALRLDRTRYNVTVCATRSAGNYQPILDEAGVQTIVIGRRSRREIYKLLKLVCVLRREPVHILHTHLFGSNTWGRLLGKLAGVPVIIAHEHWSTKSNREAQIDHFLAPLSDRILVPSEESKRVVMQSDRIPALYISVIYNGVDIAKFAPRGDGDEVRHELGIEAGAVLIGTVGRLSPEKGGVDLLIRAVGGLKHTRPRLKLVVVGEGPLRAELEAVSIEAGLDTIFTGLRSDIARLLGAMDIFVMPSLHEALPVALLEAMAAGVPVVASSVGGIPEVVSDGECGLLVPSGDVTAIEKALTRLIDDRDYAAKLAVAGRARVEARFTLDGMARNVEKIYEEITRQKLRRARKRTGANARGSN